MTKRNILVGKEWLVEKASASEVEQKVKPRDVILLYLEKQETFVGLGDLRKMARCAHTATFAMSCAPQAVHTPSCKLWASLAG